MKCQETHEAARGRSHIVAADPRVAHALLHIEQHLPEDLRAQRVAEVVGLSPSHLHALFRASVGESLGRYVLRLRLERSAWALRTTAQPVSDIAFGSGFATHEGFTRAFHRFFGVSPIAFRQRATNGACDSLALDVRLIHRAPLRVGYVRHLGAPLFAWRVWPKLLEVARRLGLNRPGALLVGIIHDDERLTSPDRFRYDAAISVPDDFDAAELPVQELPGGLFAVCSYSGALPGLISTWDAFADRWLAQSGLTWRDERIFDVYDAPEVLAGARGALPLYLRRMRVELHIAVAPGNLRL